MSRSDSHWIMWSDWKTTTTLWLSISLNIFIGDVLRMGDCYFTYKAILLADQLVSTCSLILKVLFSLRISRSFVHLSSLWYVVSFIQISSRIFSTSSTCILRSSTLLHSYTSTRTLLYSHARKHQKELLYISTFLSLYFYAKVCTYFSFRWCVFAFAHSVSFACLFLAESSRINPVSFISTPSTLDSNNQHWAFMTPFIHSEKLVHRMPAQRLWWLGLLWGLNIPWWSIATSSTFSRSKILGRTVMGRTVISCRFPSRAVC